MKLPTEEQAHELRELAKKARLVSVDLLECHAVRHSGADPHAFGASMESQLGETETGLAFKFTFSVHIVSAGDADLADADATVLAAYELTDAPSLDSPIAQLFGASVAITDAYPFIRQHIQDLTARIGLPGLTLGMRIEEVLNDTDEQLSAAEPDTLVSE